MKIFGKDLLNYRRELELLYDFAQHGLVSSERFTETYATVGVQSGVEGGAKKAGRPKKVRTPKEVYKLKALNDNKFSIEVDPAYLDEQIKGLERKLNLMSKPAKRKRGRRDDYDVPSVGVSGGAMFGRKEVESMIERLKSRKKLNGAKRVVNQFPHTTSALINKVITNNGHLRCSRADEFVPDLPKEAIKAIEDYNGMCVKVCGKKTNFYVIADREDFQRKDKRRDPILLAQSPFGFFWQILGAWDKEMIYLGDL